MNVAINPQMPAGLSTAELADGVGMDLPENVTSQVLFTKYETVNSDLQCLTHDTEWKIEVTAHPRILMGEQGREVNPDDGVIIGIDGTRRGEVGFLDRRIFKDQDEIAEYEDFNDTRIPRFIAWDFRIGYILMTNGPQLRENLHRTEEQKTQASMAQLADTIAQAFKGIGGAASQNVDNLSPQAMMDKAMGALSVVELENQLLIAKANEEVSQAEEDVERITADNAIGTEKLEASRAKKLADKIKDATDKN